MGSSLCSKADLKKKVIPQNVRRGVTHKRSASEPIEDFSVLTPPQTNRKSREVIKRPTFTIIKSKRSISVGEKTQKLKKRIVPPHQVVPKHISSASSILPCIKKPVVTIQDVDQELDSLVVRNTGMKSVKSTKKVKFYLENPPVITRTPSSKFPKKLSFNPFANANSLVESKKNYPINNSIVHRRTPSDVVPSHISTKIENPNLINRPTTLKFSNKIRDSDCKQLRIPGIKNLNILV